MGMHKSLVVLRFMSVSFVKSQRIGGQIPSLQKAEPISCAVFAASSMAVFIFAATFSSLTCSTHARTLSAHV